jgi:hypothetical protein
VDFTFSREIEDTYPQPPPRNAGSGVALEEARGRRAWRGRASGSATTGGENGRRADDGGEPGGAIVTCLRMTEPGVQVFHRTSRRRRLAIETPLGMAVPAAVLLLCTLSVAEGD